MKRMKTVFKIMLVVTFLFYLAIALSSVYVMEIGELFGYLLLGTIIIGIIMTVWVLVQPPKDNKQ
jgi:hypothetical protein